jgi:DNA-directed RNA polymerase delta subunit
MAKVSKAIVDKDLRDRVFTMIANGDVELFEKVNDRQNGIILTDMNGEERYVRLGAIVAELREDMTARELMQSEIDAYTAKQDARAEKAQKKAEKIAKDKARREAESEAKTEGE